MLAQLAGVTERGIVRLASVRKLELVKKSSRGLAAGMAKTTVP